MDINWLGHSCFRIKGSQAAIVTDPYPPDLGYALGKPAPLADPKGAGPYMAKTPSKSYLLAEFTYPILPPHQGGAMWFYSLPKHDQLVLPAEKLYREAVAEATQAAKDRRDSVELREQLAGMKQNVATVLAEDRRLEQVKVVRGDVRDQALLERIRTLDAQVRWSESGGLDHQPRLVSKAYLTNTVSYMLALAVAGK